LPTGKSDTPSQKVYAIDAISGFSQLNVTYGDIGSVFLTGGSSFVPYVRRFFSRTFGAEKVRGGEELTTVAKGLALRALENS